MEILTMSQELRGHKEMGEERRMCPAQSTVCRQLEAFRDL